MKLILNPPDMPRIWACSENHAWTIKRSKPFESKGGQRLYWCKKTNSRAEEIETFMFWERNLIHFIQRLEAAAEITRIELIHRIDGVEYDLLHEVRDESDTSRYGEETLRKAA